MIKTNENQVIIEKVWPVQQLGETQHYTTLITVRQLAEVYEHLQYDGEAQRGIIDGKAQIDEKHVDSIYKAFVNGHGIRGHLTWNIRNMGGSGCNKKDDKLVIDKKAKITIPDSAHRHAALKKIADNFKDSELLDSTFVLDIYNLNLEEEKDLFSTINGKSKQPNKNRILYLSSDMKCQLLRDVIEESDLKGRIETIKNNATGNKVTKFSTLYESLFSNHKAFDGDDITKENYNSLKTWLINFYNALLKTRSEFNFRNTTEKQEFKSKTMVLEELAWWGYGYLAKELYKKKDWNRKLKVKMRKKISVEGGNKKDFFSKENIIWHYTVIKPKYNHITQRQEAGTNVTNSNTTRQEIVRIFETNLF